MNHARKRRKQWVLQAAAALACGAAAVGGLNELGLQSALAAVPREVPIIPTVHPTITPTSAIPVPLLIRADQSSVWRSDLEQRLFAAGHVVIDIGYRSLRADNAAVWLTPSRESGESTWDVAIYLSGNVHVLEGGRAESTRTGGKELLVTTRLSSSIQLHGTPVSKAQDNNPIVRRGDELRQELLSRPPQLMHIPQITITSTEEALQAGWIARGPDNRIVAGPGDFQIARGANGKYGPIATTKPAKPRPQMLITQDSFFTQQGPDEIITVFRNPYIIYDAIDGKPPLEFHAQRAVAFSPAQRTATTNPAESKSIARSVTGVYMEGDVTLNSGTDVSVHAARIYYDFTSQRAIMLDSTLSSVDEARNVPLYMRAKEIRQLARGEYAAKDATFSTSEFRTPHYSIGASNLYLQDLTPREQGASATGPYDPTARGGATGPRSYGFKAENATVDVQGLPIFYWPYLAGDTSQNNIPLRQLRISNSQTYGLTLETKWDLFGLAGQKEPKGLSADLNLDYFGDRGPAGGVDALWHGEDDKGFLRSYVLEDRGQDRLGAQREHVNVLQDERGRILARHQQDLGDGWTLNLEGSYISDPNFLQQYFGAEYANDKEHETSAYLKHQGETDAVSLLGKFSLFDFTSTADQVDDQFLTEKKPEVKYWRIGDSFLDAFTYYSESGAANLHTDITNYTPNELGLAGTFLSTPAKVVPGTSTYRNYYQQILGWTTQDVLRGDSRHELDMPLTVGDLKITPYVTGRVTAWDDSFPDSQSGDTVRLWGSAGFRSSMQFWRVYSDVNSVFWDVHQVRHLIEPQFNVFATGADQSRSDLQPFDRDVEGISRASGTSLAINQKWQTKRGGPGHWRNVDWITFNVQWNQFWDREGQGINLFALQPLRGYYFPSRPELSLVQNSVAMDATWRVGERVRLLGEANYNTEDTRLEQAAAGLAVDQSSVLSYFVGTRYVRQLQSDQFTIAADYQLTKKYEVIASESYDFGLAKNILSSITMVRKLPRFNMALTATYDADLGDTSVVFTAWPEGFPELGVGNRTNGLTTGR